MLLTCEAGAISAPPSPPDDGKVGVSTDQWTHAGREHRIVDAPSRTEPTRYGPSGTSWRDLVRRQPPGATKGANPIARSGLPRAFHCLAWSGASEADACPAESALACRSIIGTQPLMRGG